MFVHSFDHQHYLKNLQQYISRVITEDDGQLSAQTIGTLNRLVMNLAGSARVSFS